MSIYAKMKAQGGQLTGRFAVAGGVMGLLLAGCSAPAPAPYISPRAMAALPPGTDLRTVRRRADGCYFIQTEDELSGYLGKLTDGNGNLVCDDVK